MQHRPTVGCKPAVGERSQIQLGGLPNKKSPVCSLQGSRDENCLFFVCFFVGVEGKVDYITKNDWWIFERFWGWCFATCLHIVDMKIAKPRFLLGWSLDGSRIWKNYLNETRLDLIIQVEPRKKSLNSDEMLMFEIDWIPTLKGLFAGIFHQHTSISTIPLGFVRRGKPANHWRCIKHTEIMDFPMNMGYLYLDVSEWRHFWLE